MEMASEPRRMLRKKTFRASPLWKVLSRWLMAPSHCLVMPDAPETRALLWPHGAKPVRQSHLMRAVCTSRWKVSPEM